MWQLQNAVNQLHIQRLNAIEKSARPRLYPALNTTTGTVMDIRQCTSANEENIRAEDGQVEATDIDEALPVEEGSDELEKITDFVLTLMD